MAWNIEANIQGPQGPKGADSSILNAADYGFVPGTTDRSNELRATMDALTAIGGGKLIIPPGTYKVNNHVPMASNITISGFGAIFTKDVSTPSYAYFSSLSYGQTGYGSGSCNVHVEGITFTGSFATGSVKTTCGFALHHAQNIVVEHCNFIESQGVGHSFDLQGCDSITIRDCVWKGFLQDNTAGYNKAEAIQLDQSGVGGASAVDTAGSYDGLFCKDILVENCKFLPLTANGTTYPCPNPLGSHSLREGKRIERVRFLNNYILDPIADPGSDDNDNQDLLGVIHLPCVNDFIADGNTFVQTTNRANRAIAVYSVSYGTFATSDPNSTPINGGIDPIISENIKITNNSFTGFKSSFTGGEPAIHIRGVVGGHVKGVVVSGNMFKDGILSGSGANAVEVFKTDDYKSSNNSFIDYYAGTYPRTANNVTFNGDHFNGIQTYPIFFNGCTNTSVNGCLFKDFGDAVYVNNACNTNIVSNNTFYDATGTCYKNNGSTGFIVSHNLMTARGTVAYGISTYGGGSNGKITDNVLIGYTTAVSNGSTGNNVIDDRNMDL